MNEIWKDIFFIENGEIFDYRGLYQISNYGNVKSLNYLKTGKEKMLKLRKNRSDYVQVELYKNGKRKVFYTHRLVAHMFLTGYFENAEVNHIDENKKNNHVSNLEWCNRKYNSNYGSIKKRISKNHADVSGENNPFLGGLIERWDKQGNLIDILYQFEYKKMGFNQGAISACCQWYACGEDLEEWHKHRKGYPVKQYKGFIFKYHEKDD